MARSTTGVDQRQDSAEDDGQAVASVTNGAEPALPPVIELDEEQWMQLVDEAARHYLGISGDEFIRSWRAGEFDDDPDRPEVMNVAMLLPSME